MTVEESVEVACSPEEAFALVDDLERAPEWQGSLESVDVAAGKETRRIGGQRREARFEVVRREPPRSLVIDSRSGPVEVRAAFTIGPAPAGSRVAIRLDLKLKGAMRFLGGLVRGRAEAEACKDLRRLKELLEHG
jgi:uncharacterized membrane protein